MPEPVVAPVTTPIMGPTVQVYELGIDEVKLIPGLDPLQIVARDRLVIAGAGFTVTVILYGTPEQFPETVSGVTIYSIDPGETAPGFVRT